MSLNYLGYEVLSAEDNMQKDKNLLEQCSKNVFLRLYSWKDTCVTYGYNQKEADVIKIVKETMKLNISEFVRRPTGGGLVVHSPGNLSWSLFVPSKFLTEHSLLSFYYSLSLFYAEALRECGIVCQLTKLTKEEFQEKRINDVCINYPAKYELVDENGKKLIGSAQKKTKLALIQQNNLFIREPNGLQQKIINKLTKTFSL
jgi:lipoate-protein ligase A